MTPYECPANCVNTCQVCKPPIGITNINAQIKFPEQKTLRDEFAIGALTTLRNHGSLDILSQGTAESVAKFTYAIADAMLNERNKGV